MRIRRRDGWCCPVLQELKIAGLPAVDNHNRVSPAGAAAYGRGLVRGLVPQRSNGTAPLAGIIFGAGRRPWGDAVHRSIAVPGFFWPFFGLGCAGVEQRINDLFERWVDGVEAGNSGAPDERVDDLS